MADRSPESPPAGLCAVCRHVKVVTTRSGSRFYLCRRARTDPRFPRYPPIPVLECAGFEPRDPDRAREADRAESSGGPP